MWVVPLWDLQVRTFFESFGRPFGIFRTVSGSPCGHLLSHSVPDWMSKNRKGNIPWMHKCNLWMRLSCYSLSNKKQCAMSVGPHIVRCLSSYFQFLGSSDLRSVAACLADAQFLQFRYCLLHKFALQLGDMLSIRSHLLCLSAVFFGDERKERITTPGLGSVDGHRLRQQGWWRQQWRFAAWLLNL